MSKIAIVNENDEIIGSEDRQVAYQKGLTHRLIRIFLVNDKNQVLMQFRSKDEDTFPETWDQSAGGHVDEGEDYETAAYRELQEELGVKDVELEQIDKFFTDGQYGHKIIKRFNTVFKAKYNKDDFVLQTEEIEIVKWWDIDELLEEIKTNPEKFTMSMIELVPNYFS